MKQGAIVESLLDGKRFPTYASHKISSLSDISIYTTGESVALSEVLKKLYDKEQGKEAPALKPDSEELKQYFETVLPDYDKEKVHNSDMKKVITWYNLLLKKDLLKEEEKKEEEETATKPEETGTAIPVAEKNPVKKPDVHQPVIHAKPAAAPRKVNVRRKTG